MHTTTMSSDLMSATQQYPGRSDAADWRLGRGEARRLSIGPGARWMKVAEGRVWLTTEGQDADRPGEDHWLGRGELAWLAAGSEVVVEAWGSARFELLVPPQACTADRTPAVLARPAALWRRWWARPAGIRMDTAS